MTLQRRRVAEMGAVLALAVVTLMTSAQAPLPTNTELLQRALHESVLVEGHQPFHLILELSPDTTPHAHARPTPASMHGTVELFWSNRDHYRLVLTSPEFSQTRIIDGSRVEERDNGNFYPRWLDNFVRMLLSPTPKPQMQKLLQQRLTGGGTFALPGKPTITMPRCLDTADRPAGITEETSEARICFDASHPWYQGTSDFTGYVSFADYASFGEQMIPRTWTDDIPENIFVAGKVTTLERLSKSDAATIHIETPTPLSDQIRTTFLSRSEIQGRIGTIPDFQWPTEDTEALEGYMIVYVRTDRAGNIKESYWDSSDNYKLQDAGVQLALQSRLKPLLVNGIPSQIEGPFVIRFSTRRSGSPNLN